jgi:hypothetical protein
MLLGRATLYRDRIEGNPEVPAMTVIAAASRNLQGSHADGT